MITIKTEKHTYTAKMGAEESEKLFKELVIQLLKESVRDNTVARKCMRGGDAGGDDRKRQEKGVPAKIPGM